MVSVSRSYLVHRHQGYLEAKRSKDLRLLHGRATLHKANRGPWKVKFRRCGGHS